MEPELKVKATRIGAKIYKKPIVSDAEIAYKSVKVGESFGTTTGNVKKTITNQTLVQIVIAIPDGNPLNPTTTYTDRLFWVVADGGFSFTAAGKDDVTAPGGATVDIWKTAPSGGSANIPGWLKWVGFGLLALAAGAMLAAFRHREPHSIKAR